MLRRSPRGQPARATQEFHFDEQLADEQTRTVTTVDEYGAEPVDERS